MGNIVLLDDLTINKIAAGEVIERPASVVKEMVENSIDAGATNITVEIKNGGISYIKVIDNGKGIAQDDLEIAFERHATSKIRTADDLDTVKSMGFRGEALASIAAIANVELVSKTEQQQIGYRVVVEGGDILSKEETGCQTGTSITVRNLFFNTPVRYKFLKKDYTETGYIEDAITRIALVNPNISIKLINTGKTIIQTNGNGDIKSAIYSIYGKDIAQSILNIDYNYEDIRISGVIGKPEIARSNRSNQLFFVNKRYIKDKTLTAATEQAYKGMIPIGKFGFVIMNLEINPSKVDVNVHPAKLEVRFEEENKIFQAIYHGIKDTLLKADLVSATGKENKEQTYNGELEKNIQTQEQGLFGQKQEEIIKQYTEEESKIKTNNILEDIYNSKTQKQSENISKPIDTTDVLEQLRKIKEQIENDLQPEEYTYNQENKEKIQEIAKEINNTKQEENNEVEDIQEQEVNNKLAEIQKQYEQIKSEQNVTILKDTEGENNQLKEFEKVKEKIEGLDNNTRVVSSDFKEMYAKLFGKVIKDEEENKKEEQENKLSAVDLLKDNMSIFEDNTTQLPNYKFIGIVFNTYIIIEMDKEMYIIDQHAAHERIMYEKVKKNYYSESTKDSQMLLLPDIITLTHKEMDIAKENFAMFEKAGFTLEEFGENTIKLTGVPTICVELDTKELFLETLDEINTVARTAKQEKEEKFIATVACKAAVKANMVLTKEEVESLMQKLLILPNPFTCPHGRPTAIKMTKYDIERKFARK